jgi:hypothetical protein
LSEYHQDYYKVALEKSNKLHKIPKIFTYIGGDAGTLVSNFRVNRGNTHRDIEGILWDSLEPWETPS